MSLKCEEVRERFSALWEDELSPSEQTEVKNHLELCPDCQKEYSHFDKTLRMLHSVEEEEVPGGFLSGIYEKIEERGRKGIPPEKASWRRLHLPLRLKIPMQALAMVTIVFLALYLTKMTPSELTRTKEVGESRPSSLEEKRAPVEFKTQGAEEKRPNRVSGYRQAEKIEERELSGRPKEEVQAEKAPPRSNIVAGEAVRQRASKEDAGLQPTTEEKKSGPTFAYKPEQKRVEEKEAYKREDVEVRDERAGLQSRAATPAEAPRPGGAESPSPGPLSMRKAEDASALKGTTIAGLKPSEEIVIKSSDPMKTALELQELVKKLGGETLNAERNMLLISLPNPALQEFRKKLEEVRVHERGQQVALPAAPPGGAVSDVAGKRRETEEKGKELNRLEAAKEPRTVIRIVLVEE